MRNLKNQLVARLKAHEAQQLMRTRSVRNDADFLNFTSHDYLSLSKHPEIIAVLQQASHQGIGALGSPVAQGYTKAHQALEKSITTWLNYPSALLFTSGYLAVLASLTALIDKKDIVAVHEQSHASVFDGVLLTHSTWQRYSNLERLRQILQMSSEGSRFIVTSSVFSMQGEIADLIALTHLAKQYDATIIVDDVHGSGILGENGQGAHAHFGLSYQDLPVVIGSLTKGLGTVGAFVAGDDIFIESILQFSRPYMFSTTLPAALSASSIKAIELASSAHDKRAHLQDLIHYFQKNMQNLPYQLLPSQTPIQAIVFEKIETMQKMAAYLYEKNIMVSAIRPPTVPKNSPRLRITLNCHHQKADIDRLLLELAHVL